MGKILTALILILIYCSCSSFNENPIYLNLNQDFSKSFSLQVLSKLTFSKDSKIGTTDLDGDFKREIFIFSTSTDESSFYLKEGNDFRLKFEGQTKALSGKVQDYLSLDVDSDLKEELFVAYDNRLEICEWEMDLLRCQEIINYEPCQRVTINGIDLELDQNLDIFLSCKRGEVTQNYLYNYEQGQYKDIINESKIPISHPTKYSYFADFDKDSLQDLLLVGEDASIKIMRNLGNAEFKDVDFKYKPFFRGSASIVDLDNDQDLDILISIEPGVESKEQWLVLKNQGNFQFANVTHEYFLEGAMSAEQISAGDFNLDGLNDIAATFDQYKFVEEKDHSYVLLQRDFKGKKIFSFETILASSDFSNGRVLQADLENSGRLSFIGINHLNQLWSLKNEIRVPYTSVKIVPSPKNLGTKIVLQSTKKKSYLYEVRLKDGNGPALTSTYSFGLAPLEQPLFYTLTYAGKKEKKVDTVPLNKPILLKE